MRPLLSLMLLASTLAAAEPKVDFAREIRPILSNACFKCHGPATQKAKLRLDERDAAIEKEAIIPHKPDASELIVRLTAEEGRMPPPDVGEQLKPEQIAKLKAWIAQGAEYTPHWAFQSVKRPTTGTSIDQFINAELARQQLSPSPLADKRTLIRRVTLDLLGLLPTPQQVDAFVADQSPHAYEHLVEQLLASPHYGERQARHWLDLARYADSNGYTIDGGRNIWPWRDWVIKALNDDMPFDRFTLEQLAGDLLPNATKDQLIATGFHRNTSFNEEGGTDPEQFRVERVVDRTNTTGAVWLGLTMGCAQCHDHKYDPVSQKDYYRLYAYFNNCDEPVLAVGADPKLEAKVNELTKKKMQLNTDGKLDEANKVDAEIKKVTKGAPTTLVMRERKSPRKTNIQIRGDFLRLGEEVTPGTPTVLPKSQGANRIALAKWLTSRENPLTARVTVNRAWQQFFGRGLVETENDFGIQGSLPTHQDLLDWLAVEFMESKHPWSLKHLHKTIVLSETYRRSSVATTEQRQKDPRNLWYARQSRLRLEAEIIRDVALTASGLLSKKMYGTPVYPPQPKEIFAFTQRSYTWPESKGEDRYRRGIYTYVQRQSQHPLLTTFDGADAQTACTKRNRSNTPLQALHLANDAVFVELAEGLGKRIEKDGPSDDAGRVEFAYRVCFGRSPSVDERDRVLEYAASVPTERRWMAVGRVLMNLDEFITRE